VRGRAFGSENVRAYYELNWRLQDEMWYDLPAWGRRNIAYYGDTTYVAPHIWRRFEEWQKASRMGQGDQWIEDYKVNNPTYGKQNVSELRRIEGVIRAEQREWLAGHPDIDAARARFYAYDAPQSIDAKVEIARRANDADALYVLTQPDGRRIPGEIVAHLRGQVPPMTLASIAQLGPTGDEETDGYIKQARLIIAAGAK
jgi:hypothetical protein